MLTTQQGSFTPSPFAVALASQLQGGFHSLASHLQHLNNLAQSSALSPSLISSPSASSGMVSSAKSATTGSVRKPRVGGTTMKTAKVWRYFDQLPSEEQAAECQLCRKKIKATNSSTTGMIRHLRSCHVNEYQQLQEARQGTLIVKMAPDAEEKARAALIKEMSEKMAAATNAAHKPRSPQISPHSASESCASDSSGVLGHASAGTPRPPSSSSLAAYSSLLRQLPAGLPAPKPLLPNAAAGLKIEAVETEDEEMGPEMAEQQPTDLSIRSPPSTSSTATSTSSSMFSGTASICSSQVFRGRTLVESLEERRINTQVALMLLLDGQPTSVVDRQGFRGFIKMILPSHNLPPAAQFDAEIIPDVITRLKADLSTPFALTNPNDSPTMITMREPDSKSTNRELGSGSVMSGPGSGNGAVEHVMAVMRGATQGAGSGGVEHVMAAMRAATNISRSFSHSIEIRKEEDSDSSSSADSESGMPARIDSFLNHIGRYVFPHEELISLLTICRAWFAHFEEAGHAHLLLSGLSLPPRMPGRPDLARDVAFVAENVDRLNAYLASYPETDLVPVTDHQAQFIRDLHAHIKAI